MIKQLHTIAFTHRNLEVSKIGVLHIEQDSVQQRFQSVKERLHIDEIMFLSTCNRVEYFLVTNEIVSPEFLFDFFSSLYPDFDEEKEQLGAAEGTCRILQGGGDAPPLRSKTCHNLWPMKPARNARRRRVQAMRRQPNPGQGRRW